MEMIEPGWSDDLPRRTKMRFAVTAILAGIAVQLPDLLTGPHGPFPKDVLPAWAAPVIVAIAVSMVLARWSRLRKRGAGTWEEQDRSERALVANRGAIVAMPGLLIVVTAKTLIHPFDAEPSTSQWGMAIVLLLLLATGVGIAGIPRRRGALRDLLTWTRADIDRAGLAITLGAAASVGAFEVTMPTSIPAPEALVIVIGAGIMGRQGRLAILMRRAAATRDDPRPHALRDARIGAGLTQAALAERAGTTRLTVNAIENGILSPPLPLAVSLARVLGTSVEALVPAEPQA